MIAAVLRWAGQIRVRLLAVNLLVVLVPVAGIEFARLYERTLLDALERDMRNQAALTAAIVEERLAAGGALDDRPLERALARAAIDTRMRIRLLDQEGRVVADSHRDGPPEGPEPPPPTFFPSSIELRMLPDGGPMPYTSSRDRPLWSGDGWPEVQLRREVRDALAGHRSGFTRVRESDPGVFLFVTEPVRAEGSVRGVVYVVRSTRPVLGELYRIRAGLYQVLGGAFAFTLCVTLLLAWSISRPLARLSKSAKRIAAGQRGVKIRVGGGGEIRELGEAFVTMTEKLDARLRYISDFAADVAHEFKSPLTSIRGAAELLEEGAADDPEARRRFLRNIDLDAERLDRLVSRLLELSRLEASMAAMAPIELPSIVERAARRAESPENPVVVREEGTIPKVIGRETDLETAALNLIENAVRFSPPEAAVDVRVAAADGGVVLEVRDRGPGIPDENLPRIFDRFFTTDAERSGTGLGLAIVRTVVEAHGGRVSAENAAGGGALFRVSLPEAGTRP